MPADVPSDTLAILELLLDNRQAYESVLVDEAAGWRKVRDEQLRPVLDALAEILAAKTGLGKVGSGETLFFNGPGSHRAQMVFRRNVQAGRAWFQIVAQHGIFEEDVGLDELDAESLSNAAVQLLTRYFIAMMNVRTEGQIAADRLHGVARSPTAAFS